MRIARFLSLDVVGVSTASEQASSSSEDVSSLSDDESEAGLDIQSTAPRLGEQKPTVQVVAYSDSNYTESKDHSHKDESQSTDDSVSIGQSTNTKKELVRNREQRNAEGNSHLTNVILHYSFVWLKFTFLGH